MNTQICSDVSFGSCVYVSAFCFSDCKYFTLPSGFRVVLLIAVTIVVTFSLKLQKVPLVIFFEQIKRIITWKTTEQSQGREKQREEREKIFGC